MLFHFITEKFLFSLKIWEIYEIFFGNNNTLEEQNYWCAIGNPCGFTKNLLILVCEVMNFVAILK